jgi:hypothetical protein
MGGARATLWGEDKCMHTLKERVHLEDLGVDGNIILKQDRQCSYNVTLTRVRVTIVDRGKAIGIKYSVCVSVALVIQHAKRIFHVACLALPYLLHYLIKGMILVKKSY